MVKYFSSAPFSTKSILVDTNVLLWSFYGKYGFTANTYQSSYSNFLATTLSKGIPVYTTSLNVSEVFHLIESTEFKFYCQNKSLSINSNNRTAELKKYRADPVQQILLKNELNSVYNQITKQIHILSSNVSHKNIFDYINVAPNCPDFFDLAFVQACNDNLISCILTDDADFTSFSTMLDIYTNNSKIT